MSRFSRFTKSSNPVMKEQVFAQETSQVLDQDLAQSGEAVQYERMTTQGAINKSFLLFAILLMSSIVGYVYASPVLLIGGAIGGLIIVVIATFRKKNAPVLAPLYAAVEGLFVGSVTAIYAASAYGGIILQAVTLTFALLFLMLFIYKTGIIKVTNKFRTGVIMATGAVFVVYLLSFALSFFGISIPYLHEGGLIGIGISLVIIGIASLNLLLDFDFFEKGEEYGAPAYMEWFAAMGLIITLVWLYIEILRLLAILSSND